MQKIIYLHGFASSGASGTAQLLRRVLPDYEIISPDIPLCHAMFGRHDTTVHGYDTFIGHYPAEQVAWFDGEHRVNDDVMKHAILPKMLEMLEDHEENLL